VSTWLDGFSNIMQPPWANGFYVDGIAKYVLRFDMETGENENGFFGLLGRDDACFTVVGPFNWNRSICAFQPTVIRLALNKDTKWEWSIGNNAKRPRLKKKK
jgi:hypothetical protein